MLKIRLFLIILLPDYNTNNYPLCQLLSMFFRLKVMLKPAPGQFMKDKLPYLGFGLSFFLIPNPYPHP
jgi:hypothetical protein